VNEAPSVTGFTANLPENSPVGTVVGSVAASDPDAGDTLVYAITAGNTGGAFAIDAAGQITVANPGALDFESTPSFSLTVQVQDQSGAGFTTSDAVTVQLQDVPESEPLLLDDLPGVDHPDPPERTLEPRPSLEALRPSQIAAYEPKPSEGEPARVVRADTAAGGSSRKRPELAGSAESIESAAEAERRRKDAVKVASPTDQRRLNDALEQLAEDLRRASSELEPDASLVATAEGLVALLSSGLAAFILRGGPLLASALSSLPLWKRVDPLAVLNLSEAERWQREEEMRAARQAEEEANRRKSSAAGASDQPDADVEPE
jgi:hypothetical protein